MTRARAGDRISVIVPTHNRQSSVMRLLAALARQQVADAERVDTLEVIVVADGCSDDTAEALRARAGGGEWPFSVRVLEQSPARGASSARNVGARHARGGVLLFIDDDIEPAPTMLAAHLQAHTRERSASAPLLLIGAPTPVRAVPASCDEISAWGWWEQQFERISAPGHRFAFGDVYSGVLSVPAILFAAVGGFDDAFSDAREDAELGLRLFRAGARAEFSREAGGVHHELRDLRRLMPRKRAEGRADARLLERWPALAASLRAGELGGGADVWLRAVHRITFAAPRACRAVARCMPVLLETLSRLRLRGAWQFVRRGTLGLCYWDGVRDRTGSREALAMLTARSEAARSAWSGEATVLRIDLASEDLLRSIERAERMLDEIGPDGLSLFVDDVHASDVAPRFDGERLRGVHLRRLVAESAACRRLLADSVMHPDAVHPDAVRADAVRAVTVR